MATIIFDFDGTIADSFGLFADVMHTVEGRTAPEERVSPELIERLRGMSVRQAAKEVGFSLWKIPFLMPRGLRLMRAGMAAVEPCSGMQQAIKTLAKQGHELYIMSTNSLKAIEPFLERYAIRQEFSNIYGNIGVFGKERALKRVLRRNKLDIAQTIYVGDEVRDVEGAKRAGVRMIAVTWGYNNAKILAEHHPDGLARTAEELIELLNA